MSSIKFKIFVVNTVINTVNNQEINSMAYNPYSTSQPVNISDPSGRLSVEGDGMSSFNFPYTPTITNMSNANYTQVSPTHSNFQQQFFFASPKNILMICLHHQSMSQIFCLHHQIITIGFCLHH